jgi:hypothetical protein
MTGYAYWLAQLGPYVAMGFTRGAVDRFRVTLWTERGTEVVLPRPSARVGWMNARALDALTADGKPTYDSVGDGKAWSFNPATLEMVGVGTEET